MGRALAILAVLSLGCTAPEPGEQARTGVEEAPALVALAAAPEGPQASDAVPARRVAFRMPDGTTRPLDREAIAFVPRWGGGAALVDPERRLYEVRPDGQRRMLARGATGALAASDDGATLAYVIAAGVLGELFTHDGERERSLASGLAAIGALRVTGDRVLFVGARPGGVAGVWIAGPDGAECLTNCALRTGEPFEDRRVPLPASPSSFELEAGRVAWIDHDGARHEATLAEAVR